MNHHYFHVKPLQNAYVIFHLFCDKKVYRLKCFMDRSVNLIVFVQWLEKKLKQYFKPIADIIAVDERFEQKLSSKKLIKASF